jgi:excinuclease UvrABC nuclease subunit
MEVVLGEAAQRALEAYYNVDNGEGASVLNARDVPDAIYTPHALPDPSGLERVVRAAAAAAAAADADASGTPPPLNSKTNKQPRRYVKHGIDLPPGLPTSLASLARANAVESARRTANVVAASRGLARVLRLPISSDAASSSSSDVAIRTIEGVDVSHLAGSSTAASVVSFVDGRADNAGHRRYELKKTAGGGDIAPGDDPAAIYAAVYKRVGSVRSKPLPDLLLIDGGKAQLAAAAEALRARNVEIVNLQGVGVGVGGGQDKRASGDSTRPRVALASLSKGRLSGEESVYVPAAPGENGDGFAAVRVRAGAAEDVGGAKQNLDPGMVLLRLVRDESHAVALGAHRRRRRSALFREMLDASSDDGGLGGGGGGERGGIAVAVAE